MNLEVPIDHLDYMFDLLCKKLNVSLDKGGFMTMEEKLDDVGVRYLRDKLHGRMTHARVEGLETIKLNDIKLKTISKYLGFNNFIQLQDSLKIDPYLASFIGSYYSYVRKNSKSGKILQSPVVIKIIDTNVFLELVGPDRLYSGILKLNDGCLFCLLKSDDKKSFYHIYKVGKSKEPLVIQGIFSGVSSANDPIGGRCILVKQEEEFGDLKNEIIDILDIEEKRKELFKYFNSYEENNLSILNSKSFDWSDLV